MMATEAEIIAQGKADYFSYKGVYKNPHTDGTPADFNAYERGWMQSLKRDDARLMGVSTSPFASSGEIPPVRTDQNLYALHKGRDGPRNLK